MDIFNYDETYPFEVTELEGRYTIMVPVESEQHLEAYIPIFEKYGYSGNGESWAGAIDQYLERVAPDVHDGFFLDPEAGAFYGYVVDEASAKSTLQALVPTFSDLSRFEELVASLDASRMDD